MTPLSLLLNLLWLFSGGLWMAAGWLLAALVMALTIVGLPWAGAALTIAGYALRPFGFTAVQRDADPDIGALGFAGNLIWLVLAGWWLALAHLVHAALLAITIIGIPFAWAHIKLAGLALWPVGRTIMPIDGARQRADR